MSEQTAARSHYECKVVRTQHYRDDYNYHASKDESWLETAHDLDTLYEKLAKAMVSETPEEEQGDEYVTVCFGPIREIIVLSGVLVDEARLKQAPAWQAFERERQEKKDREAAEVLAQAAREETAERAELARLQLKWPSVPGQPGPSVTG